MAIYDLAHVLIYLLVYGGAALTRSGRALGLYALGAVALGAVAGPLILQLRDDLPGRGGWDALGDALLAIMLAASCLVGFLFQALRLRLGGRGPGVVAAIHAAGLLLSPILAIGGIILAARLG